MKKRQVLKTKITKICRECYFISKPWASKAIYNKLPMVPEIVKFDLCRSLRVNNPEDHE